MASRDEAGTVSMDELILSTLATADAVVKLLIKKGIITQAELMQRISAERAGYQAILNKVRGQ